MKDVEETDIWLPGALLGLTVQPWETTPALLSEERPKFAFSFLILLFLTMFGPGLAYIWKYGTGVYVPHKIYLYLAAFTILILLLIICEGIYFFALGFEFTFHQLVATIIYSLTPLISLFFILYAFCYLATGNFNVYTYLAQGTNDPSRSYILIVPYLLIITEVCWFLITTFAIKYLNQAALLSSFVYAALNLIPTVLALFATAFLTDVIRPGAKEEIFRIINYIAGVWFGASY